MKTWLILLLVTALSLGTYVAVRHRRNPARSRATNEEEPRHPLAPEFSLSDLGGHRVRLADYRGKVVLLDFWATWCVPCRNAIPHFIELQNEYRGRGLQILGISLDDDEKPVRAFYEEFKMNYPVALGDAGLAQRYGGILGLPVSLIIGCDGRIYSKHSGETSVSTIEAELRPLLNQPDCTLRASAKAYRGD
jgi:thiol-disulfide isomerase/thioredoxin